MVGRSYKTSGKTCTKNYRYFFFNFLSFSLLNTDEFVTETVIHCNAKKDEKKNEKERKQERVTRLKGSGQKIKYMFHRKTAYTEILHVSVYRMRKTVYLRRHIT